MAFHLEWLVCLGDNVLGWGFLAWAESRLQRISSQLFPRIQIRHSLCFSCSVSGQGRVPRISGAGKVDEGLSLLNVKHGRFPLSFSDAGALVMLMYLSCRAFARRRCSDCRARTSSSDLVRCSASNDSATFAPRSAFVPMPFSLRISGSSVA